MKQQNQSPGNKRYNILEFDIMIPVSKGEERFYKSGKFKYPSIFRLDLKEFHSYLISNFPSLKYKKFNIHLNDKAIKIIHFNQTLDEIEYFDII